MEEKTLIKNLKKNNQDAYKELINLHGDRLLKSLYLMTRDLGLAEDIVQETFIKVFKNINKFKGNSSLYTWIYRISQNIAKDILSSKKTSIVYEDIEAEPDMTEDIILRAIDRNLLKKELNNLGFIYRQVLILFYFEDLSIREISLVLDEKEGTIKSKLSRGRLLLKKALEEGGGLNG